MTRTRSLLKTVTVPVGTLSIDNKIEDAIAPSVYNINPTGLNYEHLDSMEDEVTPGYFKAARTGGLLAINPMTQDSMESWTMSYAQGTTWTGVHSPTQTSKVILEHPLAIQAIWAHVDLTSMSSHIPNRLKTNWFGFPSVPVPASASELATEAISRARTSGLDVGTFAAELNKTINLIRRFHTNVRRRAGRIINDFRMVPPGRRVDRPSDTLNVFSEVWLEARYGWRTLLYDINEINGAIEKLKEGISTRSRGYASDEASSTYEWSNPNLRARNAPRSTPSSNNRTKMIATCSGTSTVERRVGALVDLVLDDIGFIDPLVTAWEVVPFSFIVDWFVNVGDALSAYSPFSTGDLVGLWTSERSTIERFFTCTAVPYLDSPDYSVTGALEGSALMRFKAYERAEMTPPPFNLSFRVNLSPAKILDLAALAALRRLSLYRRISQTTRI